MCGEKCVWLEINEIEEKENGSYMIDSNRSKLVTYLEVKFVQNKPRSEYDFFNKLRGKTRSRYTTIQFSKSNHVEHRKMEESSKEIHTRAHPTIGSKKL